MITEKDSWKVKRIRNTPRVTLAVCDMQGKVKGETVEAVATVLDDVPHRDGLHGDRQALRHDRQGLQLLLQAARRHQAHRRPGTARRLSVAPTFDEVAKAKYLLLTTFTKDGRPKPTAIWGVPDGNRLLVITDDGSWKVKRIRNTPRVTIAECGVLGKPKGEPVEAVARVLPKSETQRRLHQGAAPVLEPLVVVLRAHAGPRRDRQGPRRPRNHRDHARITHRVLSERARNPAARPVVGSAW